MAVRFYGDFKNDVGNSFRINIHDTDFSSTSTEITIATPGFVLTYEGNNQEQYQPIIPSRLDFTAYNEGGSFDTFLNSVIPAANEARFLIEVLTDAGTVSEAVFWRGVLLTEQMQLLDEPTPSAVSFTAADDLNQLKETTFDELSSAVGANAIIKRVHEMLSLTRCKSLYANSDLYLRYADDFQPEDYTGDDYIGGGGIYDVTIPGTDPVEYANCYDVLRSIAICFNARIFQAHGSWYFFPLNKFQQRSDGTDFIAKLQALTADASTHTWSTIDKLNWQSAMLYTNGTAIRKMAGNTIEYSPPIKRVERTRITNLSEYLFQGNTFWTQLDSSTNDFEFSDDDRTYFAGSTHLITVDYNLTIAAVASENTFVNNHTVRVELNIKFGNVYYTDTGFSSSSGNKNVVIGTYYKSFGFEELGQVSVQVPELAADQDGLDITLNVVVLNGAGGDITGSLPTHNALNILRVYAGDSADAIGDEVVFGSETSLSNQVRLFQDNVLTGNVGIGYGTGSADVAYYNGSFHGTGLDHTSWTSSQTATGYPLHRLGVREIMYNVQLPHRIRQGDFYVEDASTYIWPYALIREDSQDHVAHELQYHANESTYTIERFELNQSTANLSFRANVVNTNNPRDRFAPNGSTGINKLTTDVSALQQQQDSSGGKSSVHLEYLGDVKISGVQDNQILQYNSAASKWANTALSPGYNYPKNHVVWNGTGSTATTYFTPNQTAGWIGWSTLKTYMTATYDSDSNTDSSDQYVVPETGLYEMNIFCAFFNDNASDATEVKIVVGPFIDGSDDVLCARTTKDFYGSQYDGVGGTCVFEATAAQVITPNIYLKIVGSGSSLKLVISDKYLHAAIRQIA